MIEAIRNCFSNCDWMKNEKSIFVLFANAFSAIWIVFYKINDLNKSLCGLASVQNTKIFTTNIVHGWFETNRYPLCKASNEIDSRMFDCMHSTKLSLSPSVSANHVHSMLRVLSNKMTRSTFMKLDKLTNFIQIFMKFMEYKSKNTLSNQWHEKYCLFSHSHWFRYFHYFHICLIKKNMNIEIDFVFF